MGLQKRSINRQDSSDYISKPIDEVVESLQQIIQDIAKFKGSKCFLVEYYSKRIICPEDSTVTFCRDEIQEIREKGWNFYTQYVPSSEIQKIVEAAHATKSLLNGNLQSSFFDYSTTFDLHFCRNNKTKLVNHKIFPLLITSDNQLWMVCTLSPASHKDFGAIQLYDNKDGRLWKYAFSTHQWDEQVPIRLTQAELDILYYAAQDYSIEEIAEVLYKSIDAIKSTRKNLFKKLNVKSIVGAVQWAKNNHLL